MIKTAKETVKVIRTYTITVRDAHVDCKNVDDMAQKAKVLVRLGVQNACFLVQDRTVRPGDRDYDCC